MGVVEGQLGTVIACYAVTAAGIVALVLWVALGHARVRREIARLERAAER